MFSSVTSTFDSHAAYTNKAHLILPTKAKANSATFTYYYLTSLRKSIQLVKLDLLYQYSQGNTMWRPNLQAAFLKTVKHYNCPVYFGTKHYALTNALQPQPQKLLQFCMYMHKIPSVCATCCMLINYIPKLPDWAVCRWSHRAKRNIYSKWEGIIRSIGKKSKHFSLLCYFIISKSLVLFHYMCTVPTFRTIQL